MIAVHNVTVDDTQELDDYEVRLNGRVIGEFQHKRGPMGLARCLRDAADAVDRRDQERVDALIAQCAKEAQWGGLDSSETPLTPWTGEIKRERTPKNASK